MTIKTSLAVISTLSTVGLLAGSAWADEGTCAAALSIPIFNGEVTEATYAAEAEGSLIDHCIVRGVLNERTGTDGRTYAIRFELRLPDDWSGQFLHQFNGGNDGTVVPAFGEGDGTGGRSALSRGFAVVSSDAGHDGNANPELGLAGGNAFGFDFQARRDYGYAAVATLHPVALALVEEYYGEPADFVYGYGGSNGGRHGMVAVERMPDAFDGILAGYPGYNLPKTGLQSALDIQTFLSIAPTLAEAFSREELTALATGILSACDALDGLEDGVVNDYLACELAFVPDTMACSEGQNSGCLPPEKVSALKTIQAGPISSDGVHLYNSWYWDPGIASENWRFWRLESPIPSWEFKPLIATLAAGSLAQIFTTPPTSVGPTASDLEAFMSEFDLDGGAAKIYATTEDFPESAMEMLTPPNADNPTLGTFEEDQGKLIIYHGTADPIFSFKDTADWFDRLIQNNPNAGTFVRLFVVPGMPHGQGGNSADSFDLLTPLVAWVEEGIPPGEPAAKFRSDNPESSDNAGASRPLCAYPLVARYTGDDPTQASSFTCAQ